MVQVTPVVRPKIVKKKVTKFKRHQSDRFKRLSVSAVESCRGGGDGGDPQQRQQRSIEISSSRQQAR